MPQYSCVFCARFWYYPCPLCSGLGLCTVDPDDFRTLLAVHTKNKGGSQALGEEERLQAYLRVARGLGPALEARNEDLADAEALGLADAAEHGAVDGHGVTLVGVLAGKADAPDGGGEGR